MKRLDPGSLELVFVDPPYDSAAATPALAAAAPLVRAGGYVYFEAGEPVDPQLAASLDLIVYRQARAGSVHFHLLQRRSGVADQLTRCTPADATLSGSGP